MIELYIIQYNQYIYIYHRSSGAFTLKACHNIKQHVEVVSVSSMKSWNSLNSSFYSLLSIYSVIISYSIALVWSSPMSDFYNGMLIFVCIKDAQFKRFFKSHCRIIKCD